MSAVSGGSDTTEPPKDLMKALRESMDAAKARRVGSGSTNKEPERCPLVLEGRQCTMQARHYGEYHVFGVGAVPADEPTDRDALFNEISALCDTREKCTPAGAIGVAVEWALAREAGLRGRLAAVAELHPKIEHPRHGCCAEPKVCKGEHEPECGGRTHGLTRPTWPCPEMAVLGVPGEQ